MSNGKYRLGIDIGGTFTDFALYKENHDILDFKVRTSRKDFSDGIIEGLKWYQKQGLDLSRVKYLVHGMTVGLNSLLQRRGSKIALFTTAGFRDILNIQRLRLPVPYNFYSRLPKPLIPRANVFSIKERLNAKGQELTQVSYPSIDSALKVVKARNLKGVVVSFLHSYLNPQHEKAVQNYIQKKAPGLPVEIASDLNSNPGEYERTVFAIINLFIQKDVKNYLQTLNKKIHQQGVNLSPLVTTSNAGITSLENASERPVQTLFSGPASGALGAAKIAEGTNNLNAITVDIGGTSADISLIENGEISLTETNTIGGFPIVAPSIELYSIGAGGGSYIWFDKGGILKVGPTSAGSYPGPAAYGTGNEPTLTDAFIVSNYLNPKTFAGGHIKLNATRSQKAIKTIATRLKTTTLQAADRAISVVIANMTTELSSILSQHGINPKDFSLISYGGAGPLLANRLAQELSLKNIIYPLAPGNLSALGALYTNYIYNGSQVYLHNLNQVGQNIVDKFNQLYQSGKNWLNQQAKQNIAKTQARYFVNARYSGQTLELSFPVDLRWFKSKDYIKQIKKTFDKSYLKAYNHNLPNADVDLTKLSIELIGITPKPQLKAYPASKSTKDSPVSFRRIVLQGKEINVPVFNRSQLTSEKTISGPALVDQNDTTILLLPKWAGKVDSSLNLVVYRENKEEANNEKN